MAEKEEANEARALELSSFTWARMLRIAQKIRRAADNAVRETNYSAAQLGVLFQVLGSEGLTQQELASQLDVTKGNIARLLNKLESDGLIERQPDGRMNNIVLTPRGRQVAHSHLASHRRFIADQLSPLSAQEIEQLNTLLRKLDRALK